MADKTEQELIDDGARVRAFVDDPAVKDAIRKVAERFFDEFKASRTPADREMAWAKSAALDALSGELLAVVQNGEIAVRQRQQREAQERLRRNRK